MGNINFAINNKLEICWDDNYYKSNVADIQDDHISINIPITNGSYLTLKKGDRIEVIYYDENNVYKFNTVVTGRKFANVPLITIAIPNSFKKIQRRKFVRVSYVKYINYTTVADDDQVIDNLTKGDVRENGIPLKEAILVDLSGGGLRVKVSDNLHENDELVIFLEINKDLLELKCKVVRSFKDDEGRYDCGLTFIDIDDRTREKIIGFTFKIMREHMRKV